MWAGIVNDYFGYGFHHEFLVMMSDCRLQPKRMFINLENCVAQLAKGAIISRTNEQSRNTQFQARSMPCAIYSPVFIKSKSAYKKDVT